MPSLYGSAEGPGSGWGVRLSNVKLREGAELMTLPGSRKAKPPKEKPPIPKGERSSHPPTKEGADRGSSKEGKTKETYGRTLSKPKSADGHRRGHRNGYNTQERRHENGVRTNPERDASASSSDPDDHNLEGAGHTAGRQHADTDYSCDDDSLSSLQEVGDPRPETPVQDSSISFLRCFAPEDAKKEASAAQLKKRQQHQTSKQKITDSSQQDHDANGESSHRLEDPRIVNLSGHFRPVSDDEDHDDTGRSMEDELFGVSVDEHDINHNDDDDHRKDSEGDDDEDEPPMILRIGEGTIGTLDIRLVGRELHVMVEDAFLTLEIVRKSVSKDDPDSKKSPAEGEHTTTDAFPAEQPAEKKPAVTPVPIDINDLKTTGERILASNPIARIFSSIPQLFLRDILVRLVVLDETQEGNCTSADGEEKETTGESSDGDNAELIVDVGIGFLSVTDGEDFLSPFNNEDNLSQGEDLPPSLKRQTSQSGSSSENAYLERRIRTGKGSEGGIWLNVVTPKTDHSYSHRGINKRHVDDPAPDTSPRWARSAWLEATRYCVLRTSGVDIQARIFLGTKKELSQASSSYWSEDPETYQGIDHTLYGFDHVVPGPTPNQLPPLAPPPSNRSFDDGDDSGNLRSQIYSTDRNGIQSSKIDSCFYRVARGLTPKRCTLEHLPCENCKECWEANCQRTTETVDEIHPLDLVTPMPGLALSVSFRDPLEVNLDRMSLDGLGLLIGLFKKPAEESERLAEQAAPTSMADATRENLPKTELKEAEAGGSYFSSFFFGSNKTDELPPQQKSLPPAFPTYMKPENIQILGVHVAELRFRVHVMHPDDQEKHNTGLSFCYWDARIECMTLDQQKLTSDEKLFQDLRFDAAILEMNEFKGTQQKIVLSSGLPYPITEGDISPAPSANPFHFSIMRPPWPNTVCALLDVPPSFESRLFESRERHGLQLRMLQVTENPKGASERLRSLINCQVGAAEINLPWPVGAAFTGIKDEVKKSLLRTDDKPVEAAEDDDEAAKNADAAKQYRVQLGGGRVRLGTMLDVRLPLTRLAGDICPQTGFSMETLIERAELSYGTSSDKIQATANSAQGFSLKRLTSLPEPVRLRILLFVEDLEPLEKALGVKRQSKSFLRYNAVNKGLGKIASKKGRKKSATESKLNHRQQLMNKLLALDDNALESLWATHQKKQRKVKRTGSAKKAH